MNTDKGKTPRKTLTFDPNNEEEMIAYNYLEKTRYYQTKFITRLILDYIERYSIDINGDYSTILSTCKKYIENDTNETEVWETKYSQITEYLSQMSEDIDKLKEKLSVNHGISKPLITEAETVIEKKQEQIITKPQSAPLDEYLEEEEETEGFGSMLSSFKTMAES